MKLKDLKDCYFYTPVTKKVDGETTKKWKYKFKARLNVQQDISELDRNSAGVIDYDVQKLRIDYNLDIKKEDGLSFTKLVLDENNFTINPPEYIVSANPKIGNKTTYTCKRYYGE